MKKQRGLPGLRTENWRILYDAALFSLGMLIAFALPFLCYTYSDVVYELPLYRFLTGGRIAGGTVALSASAHAWVCAVCAVGILLLSLLRPFLPRKASGILLTALSLAAGAAMILFTMRVEGDLSAAGAKRVGVLLYYMVFLACDALSLQSGLRVLHQEGVLPDTWDVMALGLAVVMTMAAPLGTYTYKRVSHPFTSFDLLQHKEIASETVTEIGPLGIVLLICGVLIVLAALLAGIRRKRGAGLLLLFSAGAIVCVIFSVMNLKTGVLSPSKNPETSLFSFVPILLAVWVFARGLHLLYKERVLSALDFMMVPGLLYLLVNNYLPMIGISLAFKKIDYSIGIWKSPWNGLDNFKYLFSTKTAWIITRNTLLYNLVFIVVGIFTGMVVGICLAAVAKKLVRTFFQTSILLPQLISMVIVAYIVYAFLSNVSGFVNTSILKENAINFYGEKKVWPFLLVFINNWKQLGYNSVIFLSSIVGIDKGLYEAAEVDGCSKLQQVLKITIPQLKPTIITLTLLQVGRVFYSDFGLFYQVTMDSGAIYDVTNTIDTFVYRSLMVLNNLSSASAASAFQAVCGFILVFTVNMIVRKLDRDNALF